MVYINSWQKYQEAAENLYANSLRKVWHPLRSFFFSPSVPVLPGLIKVGRARAKRKRNVNENDSFRLTDYWKTRYSVKWKSSEGKLVLKITDDVTVRKLCPSPCKNTLYYSVEKPNTEKLALQCLKFKTHSSIFLGRFEALNRSLIQKMMNTRPPPPPPPPPAAAAAQIAPATVSTSQPQVAAGSKSSSTPAASTGGGVKKKKGKKK